MLILVNHLYTLFEIWIFLFSITRIVHGSARTILSFVDSLSRYTTHVFGIAVNFLLCKYHAWNWIIKRMRKCSLPEKHKKNQTDIQDVDGESCEIGEPMVGISYWSSLNLWRI